MLRIRSKAQNDLAHLSDLSLRKIINICENLSILIQGAILAGVNTHRIASDSPHIRTSFERYESLRTMVVEAAIAAGIHVHAYQHLIHLCPAGGSAAAAAPEDSHEPPKSKQLSRSLSKPLLGTHETSTLAMVQRLITKLERSQMILEEQARLTDQNDLAAAQDLVRECIKELRVSKSIRSGVDKDVSSLVWFTILDYASHMPLTSVLPLIGQEFDARKLLTSTSRTLILISCVKSVAALVVPPRTAPTALHPQGTLTPAAKETPASTAPSLFRYIVPSEETPTSTCPDSSSTQPAAPTPKVPLVFRHAHVYDYARLTRDILGMMDRSFELRTTPGPKTHLGIAAIGTVKATDILTRHIREKFYISKLISGHNPFDVFGYLPDHGVDPLLISPSHPYLANRALVFAMTFIFRNIKDDHVQGTDTYRIVLKFCGTLEGIIEGMANDAIRTGAGMVRFGHMGNTTPESIKRLVCDEDLRIPEVSASYHAFFTSKNTVSLMKRAPSPIMRLASASPATTMTQRTGEEGEDEEDEDEDEEDHQESDGESSGTEEGAGAGAGAGAAGAAITPKTVATVVLCWRSCQPMYVGDPFGEEVHKTLARRWQEVHVAQGISDTHTIIWQHEFVPLEAHCHAMRWKPKAKGRAKVDPTNYLVGSASIATCVGSSRGQEMLTLMRPLFSTTTLRFDQFKFKTRTLQIRTFSCFVPVVPFHCHSLLRLYIRPEGILKPVQPNTSLTIAEFFFMALVQEAHRRGLKVVVTDSPPPPADKQYLPIFVTRPNDLHPSMNAFLETSLTVSCLRACAKISAISVSHTTELKGATRFVKGMVHIFESELGWGILPAWHSHPPKENMSVLGLADVMAFLLRTRTIQDGTPGPRHTGRTTTSRHSLHSPYANSYLGCSREQHHSHSSSSVFQLFAKRIKLRVVQFPICRRDIVALGRHDVETVGKFLKHLLIRVQPHDRRQTLP